MRNLMVVRESAFSFGLTRSLVFALLLAPLGVPVTAHGPSASLRELATAGDATAETPEDRCRLEAELERLREVQDRVQDQVLALPGVVGLGIGRAGDELLFSILVDGSARPDDLPRDLEGVPTQVQLRKPVQLVDGLPACGDAFPCHVDQQPLPVEMGNSGGWISQTGAGACSLGFKACDLGTGKLVFVTNSHCNQSNTTCALPAPGSASDGWIHPGRMDTPPTGSSCFSDGTCTLIGEITGHAAPSCGSGINYTDATKVESSNELTAMSFRDIGFPQAYPGVVLPLDPVRKSGRTTGDTSGLVVNVSVTVEVPAPAPGVDGYCCGALTMEDQIEWVGLTGPIKGGDSGSALLSAGSEFQVVGLNWGSDGTYNYANNVDRVLAALNLSLNFVSCFQDCLYSAAAEAASGLEEWKTDEDDGLGLLDLGHRFRDQVLQESAVGRQLTQMYYQFSDEAVRLAARSPGLLLDTAALLTRYAPNLKELVLGGRTTVAPADLDPVDRLLEAYAAGASPAMQDAVRQVREAMRDPAVQEALGVEVAGTAAKR